MTSKDEEQIVTFKSCLGLQNRIGKKARGGSLEKKYFVLQFGDANFYEFLVGIGLKPAKSKTLGQLLIPKEYFRDFLRGCIDGDGNINIFSHPESKNPQLRIRLYSASSRFINWIKEEIHRNIGIATGWIEGKGTTRIYKLCFAKEDSIKLLKFIYYKGFKDYLIRKHETARNFLI